MTLIPLFIYFTCIHVIVHAFNLESNIHLSKSCGKLGTKAYNDSFLLTRSSFLLTCTIPIPAKAIEFVPPSPTFNGTYKDALEILYTQRIALDNIREVISSGKLDEAGFKLMQLSAQTRVAGKIVLDTLQESISNNGAMLRYLSCQKKFAILVDLCDECGIVVQNALKGKLGAVAPAQIKIGVVVEDAILAYDDFLAVVRD